MATEEALASESTASSTTVVCTFLKRTPREIRDLIYEYALDDERVIVVHTTSKDELRIRAASMSGRSILRACRQTRHEALEIHYRIDTVYIAVLELSYLAFTLDAIRRHFPQNHPIRSAKNVELSSSALDLTHAPIAIERNVANLLRVHYLEDYFKTATVRIKLMVWKHRGGNSLGRLAHTMQAAADAGAFSQKFIPILWADETAHAHTKEFTEGVESIARSIRQKYCELDE